VRPRRPHMAAPSLPGATPSSLGVEPSPGRVPSPSPPSRPRPRRPRLGQHPCRLRLGSHARHHCLGVRPRRPHMALHLRRLGQHPRCLGPHPSPGAARPSLSPGPGPSPSFQGGTLATLAWGLTRAAFAWGHTPRHRHRLGRGPSSPSPGAAPSSPGLQRHRLARTLVAFACEATKTTSPAPLPITTARLPPFVPRSPLAPAHRHRAPLAFRAALAPAHHHRAAPALRAARPSRLPITTMRPHFVPRSPLVIAALASCTHTCAGCSPA
ncbi:hypothetical protein BC826DRAFT_1017788, partial [Russula brevipes]